MKKKITTTYKDLLEVALIVDEGYKILKLGSYDTKIDYLHLMFMFFYDVKEYLKIHPEMLDKVRSEILPSIKTLSVYQDLETVLCIFEDYQTKN